MDTILFHFHRNGHEMDTILVHFHRSGQKMDKKWTREKWTKSNHSIMIYLEFVFAGSWVRALSSSAMLSFRGPPGASSVVFFAVGTPRGGVLEGRRFDCRTLPRQDQRGDHVVPGQELFPSRN